VSRPFLSPLPGLRKQASAFLFFPRLGPWAKFFRPCRGLFRAAPPPRRHGRQVRFQDSGGVHRTPETGDAGATNFGKLARSELDRLERYHQMLDACGVPKTAQDNIFAGTMWKILSAQK
jgi:hypothetical protein